jgi:hypothetical protein
MPIELLDSKLKESEMIRTNTVVAALVFALAVSPHARAEQDGFLHAHGQPLFPIGFYSAPEDEAAYADMAEAGVNLIRCGGVADLDRAHGYGLNGWISLPMSGELTPEGEKQIMDVLDHPALAVWEGPDEMVWNFTAYSGLFRDGTHERKGAWSEQTPKAVAFAEQQAATIMPNVQRWTARIRELDAQKRPIWFNEAYTSDVLYMRQYLGAVDITGCDLYPVKSVSRNIAEVGDFTERFNQVGKGKPVWMVLQAFSWHEVKTEEALPPVYPTFAESRFMAWNAITHGAKGVLYWGSSYTKNQDFIQSLYAVTSELAGLQPFLTAPDESGVSLNLIEEPTLEKRRGVSRIARYVENEGLVVLVNEDDVPHFGTEVQGLDALKGRTMHQLHGNEACEVVDGAFVTRLLPREVKIFSTTLEVASTRLAGRDFGLTE